MRKTGHIFSQNKSLNLLVVEEGFFNLLISFIITLEMSYLHLPKLKNDVGVESKRFIRVIGKCDGLLAELRISTK